MIIFLYGPDSYRRGGKAREIVARYRAKYSASGAGRFDADDESGEAGTGVSGARDFLAALSLFDAKRLAVIASSKYGVFGKDDIAWLRGLRDTEDCVVVLSCAGAPTKAFSFLLEPPAVSQEFARLHGGDFTRMIMALGAERGMRLSGDECARLDALHAGDVAAIATELDMLSLIPAGEQKAVLQGYGREAFDFFGMMRNVGNNVPEQKVPIIFRMGLHEDAGKIFNILSAFVSGEKKRLMADHDIAIKTGLLDYDLALTDFAIR